MSTVSTAPRDRKASDNVRRRRRAVSRSAAARAARANVRGQRPTKSAHYVEVVSLATSPAISFLLRAKSRVEAARAARALRQQERRQSSPLVFNIRDYQLESQPVIATVAQFIRGLKRDGEWGGPRAVKGGA
jgi:hypothetical protein